MRQKRTTLRQSSTPGYDNLENRQMLTSLVVAPLFTGTSQADQVEVRYVDDNTVDIQINDTLHEGVRSTNGIRINLGNSNFNPSNDVLTNGDNITIDQRITTAIFVSGTEGITILGDEDNLVQTSFRATSASEMIIDLTVLPAFNQTPDDVIGNINGNIAFIGATEIQTGGGDDVFNLSNNGRISSFSSELQVNAGAGDDLVRFTGQQRHVPHPLFQISSHQVIMANGESGNDRFVYRDLGGGGAVGGEGVDIVDRQFSTNLDGDTVNRDTVQTSRVSVAAGIERYIVSADIDTSATLVGGDNSQRFEWDVDGGRTVLTDVLSGTSIELLNYNQFVGAVGATDTFYISSTADNLKIINADFVWITSSRDATQGDLGGIEHEISFENTALDFTGASFLASSIIAPSVGGVAPTVFISDAAGDGLNATLGPDQTISGIGGGLLKFVGAVEELTVFGSTEGNDSIIVEETWAPTTIYTRGGDDTFMTTCAKIRRIRSLKAASQLVARESRLRSRTQLISIAP